jgi:rubrerythrin
VPKHHAPAAQPPGTRPTAAASRQPLPKAAVIWTCPMHPQVQSDKPGKCPICGMDLVPKKTS